MQYIEKLRFFMELNAYASNELYNEECYFIDFEELFLHEAYLVYKGIEHKGYYIESRKRELINLLATIKGRESMLNDIY